MNLLKVKALRGPNVWSRDPVLEVWIDPEPIRMMGPDGAAAAFRERLLNWLPELAAGPCHAQCQCIAGASRAEVALADVLEHVTIELQKLAGSNVRPASVRRRSYPCGDRVAIRYEEESLARACLEAARQVCDAALRNEPCDIKGQVERLRSLAQDVCLGPSTRAIVRAAEARGIPTRRLNGGSLILLGHAARQRRIRCAETDRTSAIAEDIAQDKQLTRDLLRAVGVPAAQGRPVNSGEEAWEAACDLGLPVVVKPRYGNQGRGVATNLATREQVLAAYEAARKEESTVLVERFAPGQDHRLLVVGDRVVAAARRQPAHVIGDGRHTVEGLAEIVNSDPRRGDGHGTVLTKIRFDHVALGVLADQGLTPQSVPAAGQMVLIRRNGNLSTGGTAEDVTDRVHPQVAARAVEAARVVGLDIAGIDVVAVDLGRPLEEQGGVIVEVNASPGLRMHVEPSSGLSRPVGEAIVAELFPAGKDGRIPVAAITGTNGKTTTTRLIAHMFSRWGKRVGMACSDGVYVEGRRIEAGDCSGPNSARAVLLNPAVEAAVLETARGGILREGLGFDRCDVAVVTNIGEGDHLGIGGIDTLADMAAVKRTLVEAVAPGGAAVLNAEDPLVAVMAAHSAGSVVFFARDGGHGRVRAHRDAGGRVVYVRNDSIVLACGMVEEVLAPLARVPLTMQGRIEFQVENTLAAVAAAWALGLPPDVIRAALASFTSDVQQVPGRFNVLHVDGSTVLLDFGHNPSALWP